MSLQLKIEDVANQPVTTKKGSRLRAVSPKDNVFGFNEHGDFVIQHPSGSRVVLEANGNVVVNSVRNAKILADGHAQLQPEAWDDPDVGEVAVNPASRLPMPTEPPQVQGQTLPAA